MYIWLSDGKEAISIKAGLEWKINFDSSSHTDDNTLGSRCLDKPAPEETPGVLYICIQRLNDSLKFAVHTAGYLI